VFIRGIHETPVQQGEELPLLLVVLKTDLKIPAKPMDE
jgi:hypothetical protein